MRPSDRLFSGSSDRFCTTCRVLQTLAYPLEAHVNGERSVTRVLNRFETNGLTGALSGVLIVPCADLSLRLFLPLSCQVGSTESACALSGSDSGHTGPSFCPTPLPCQMTSAPMGPGGGQLVGTSLPLLFIPAGLLDPAIDHRTAKLRPLLLSSRRTTQLMR